MTLTARPRLTAWLLVLGACGPEKSDTTDSASSSAATTGTTDASAPTTTAANTTSSSAGTADASASAATTGLLTTEATDATDTTPPPVCAEATPEDEARCAVETIRDRCRAVEVDPAIGACKWVSWTSVRLVDDVCMFGDSRGACFLDPCSPDGCDDAQICGMPGKGAFFDAMGISIGRGDWCTAPPAPGMPCEVDAGGDVLSGPPECACLCELP